MTIMYDHKQLEELAGGPLEPLAEDDLLGRSTARAVCDFHTSASAESSLYNAQAWIERVRNNAFQEGVQWGKDFLREQILARLGLGKED